jgi:predicted phage baseplate assembly protein
VTRRPEDPTDEVDPTTWTPVRDFDASGPDDRHYVLDRTRGEIVFGDGIRGAVPEPGRVVEATAFSYGGGRDGNVPPSAVWRVDADAVERGSGSTAPVEALARLTITPLGGATGGREAETVSDTVARVRRDRRTPTRGVSLADFEYLARHTPGLRVDRATAIADVPAPNEADRLDRPHVVRVVVVPDSTLDRPVPSDAFLDAVQRHLDARTLLTDCVVAESPVYVGVGVVAEIGVVEGFTTSGRVAAVTEALDRFLSPVRRPDADDGAENPDGDGWPLGRPVYPSEVYEVIEGVDGVDCVFDVSLRARGAGTAGDGRLPLPPTGLPYPLSHDVRVRTVDSYGRRDR